jgi:hypothetical protein
LNWQAHEQNTPLQGITHKEARMFRESQAALTRISHQARLARDVQAKISF